MAIEEGSAPVFVKWGTGGGCTAWRCELPGGYYILLTDNDASHKWEEKDYAIGLYKSGGETEDDKEVALVYQSPY